METTRRQRIRSVVHKELRHIFRDRVSCLLLFLMPAVVLLLFGYALSFEMHHVHVKVYNPGHHVEGERFFARLDANPKIRIIGRLESLGGLDDAFAHDHTRAVIIYDPDRTEVFLDGMSSILATNVQQLIGAVMRDFVKDESRGTLGAGGSSLPVRFRYNPSLKKEYMTIPGLVMMIFILISSIVLGTSFNKEKVQGSYRLLRMTGLSSGELIAGKSLPYLVISLFHVAVVYLICPYFGITIQGSLAMFLFLCILYSICCMSLGLLIAAWFDRPLDVLILCWIVLFIPNVFLSGFAFPVSSIEGPVRTTVGLLPGTAFISAFRNVAYKGTGLAENLSYVFILAAETVLAFGFSLAGFKRRIPR